MGAAAKDQSLIASAVEDVSAVITSLVEKAQQRYIIYPCTWVKLQQGYHHQIDRAKIQAEACDLIHVCEYLRKSTRVSHGARNAAGEAFVPKDEKALTATEGSAVSMAPRIWRKAPMLRADTQIGTNTHHCVDNLVAKSPDLNHPTVIGCRHLVHARPEVTHIRLDLDGAEVISKPQPSRSNNDGDCYSCYQSSKERQHNRSSFRYSNNLLPTVTLLNH